MKQKKFLLPEGGIPDRWIDIPQPVLERYACYRSIPLVRAYALEEALGTPAHIYFKIPPQPSGKPGNAGRQASRRSYSSTSLVTALLTCPHTISTSPGISGKYMILSY